LLKPVVIQHVENVSYRMLFCTGSRSITQEVLLKDITESSLGRKIYSGVEQFSICLEYSARCVV